MKKLILLFTVICCTALNAQQVCISYEGEWNLGDFERTMLLFGDMHYMVVHLDAGTDENYTLELTRSICRSGSFEHEQLIKYPVRGKAKFRFVAEEKGDGIVRIGVDAHNSHKFESVELPYDKIGQRIFMETYPEDYALESCDDADSSFYSDADEIPIVGYTTGIKSEIEYMGEKGTWVDYCGLRAKSIHPAKWHSEAGIDSYVYYTVKLHPSR